MLRRGELIKKRTQTEVNMSFKCSSRRILGLIRLLTSWLAWTSSQCALVTGKLRACAKIMGAWPGYPVSLLLQKSVSLNTPKECNMEPKRYP